MANFSREQGGFITKEDLAEFHVGVRGAGYHELSRVRRLRLRTVVPGADRARDLNILEGYDLPAWIASAPTYYHLILEALKASFADRDRYYGDPRFVDVPMDGLLNKKYAAEWRERISLKRSQPGMPEPGNAWAYASGSEKAPSRLEVPRADARRPVEPDTSYLCVVDRDGNAFSATPSDGATNTPIVPGLGLIMSSRGMQTWLDPDHPGAT